MHPQITSLQPEAPGREAGMRPGDVVMAAAGERDVTNKRLIEVIKAHEGKTITIEIKRDGQILQVPVTPRQHRRHGHDRCAVERLRSAHHRARSI